MKRYLSVYSKILSSTQNLHAETLHLTGIRGYAILGVFGVHYLQYLHVENPFLKELISFGRYGVIVFFVLSAFTILLSIANKKFNLKSYLIRRIFRILPVYFFMILIGFILGGVAYYNNIFGVANSVRALFMHFYFLNLIDLRYINNILGVEWTIPIEVFFYFLIPFVYFAIIKRPKLTLPVILIGLLISYLGIFAIPSLYQINSNVDLYYQFSVLKYFFTYALGISLFVIFVRVKNLRVRNAVIWLSLLSLPIFIALGFAREDFLNVVFVSLWSCLLILVCSRRDKLTRLVFENKWIVYLGNISYSFYLIHFIFTIHNIFPEGFSDIAKIIFAFIASLILASISYFIIERPFIFLGKEFTLRK